MFQIQMNNREIAKTILKFRNQHGLTQQELAKITGVSSPTIFNYEHEKIPTSPKSKRILFKLLNFINNDEKTNFDHTAFWNNIRMLRYSQKIRQRDLAKAINASTSYLSLAENGLTIAWPLIPRAAQFFHMTPNEIVNLKWRS